MASVRLIDTHLHIYRTREEGRAQKEGGYVIWEYGQKPDVRFSQYDGNLEDALDAIQKGGFSRAAVMNLFTATRTRAHAISALPDGLSADERSREIEKIDATMADNLIEFNTWICELVEPYDQLVPFVAADPMALPGEPGAAHLRDMVENHGARGIKLHPMLQDFHASDERMWPVYRTCQELGVAVVSHSGPARGGEPYAEPHAFARALEAFPELKMVVAHMGGATWGQCLELARSYPNAYFDCCEIIEWCGAPNAPTDAQLARLFRDIGADRVMMGSDFPWYDLDRQVERVMELPVLSREEKEGVVGANAERILGL
jgi:predicted TIM-barrel fold metal-dependent hydrolase